MARLFRIFGFLISVYLLSIVVLVVAYRFVPPASAFMLTSKITNQGMDRRWVPLARVSPNLIRAVLVSEDAAFCTHHGIDWRSVDKALDERRKRGPRGASTIPMQVAKNLFFWNGRSWVRKALEAPIALWIDFTWPKRRILEVYLNIAQWGNGVFGIEAAARHQFGVSASQLSTGQAVLLVTMLPDPEHRSARRPGPGHQRMAANLLGRMGSEGANTSCLRR